MTVSNLGVCFGPTLLRPEEETVASIMDLKFYNVVVEILIENYDKIFNTEPDADVSPEKSVSSQTTSGYGSNHLNKAAPSSSSPVNSSDHVMRYVKNEGSEHVYVVKPHEGSDHVYGQVKQQQHVSSPPTRSPRFNVYNQPVTCVSFTSISR